MEEKVENVGVSIPQNIFIEIFDYLGIGLCYLDESGFVGLALLD